MRRLQWSLNELLAALQREQLRANAHPATVYGEELRPSARLSALPSTATYDKLVVGTTPVAVLRGVGLRTYAVIQLPNGVPVDDLRRILQDLVPAFGQAWWIRVWREGTLNYKEAFDGQLPSLKDEWTGDVVLDPQSRPPAPDFYGTLVYLATLYYNE